MSIISFFSRRGSKGDLWDPFDGVSFSVSPFAGAQVDWKETPDAHIYIADFPGMKKDEVKIEVEEEKLLKISSQRMRETEEKNDKWHRIKRSSDQIFRIVKFATECKY
ncbi:putative small heat shock protein HSP20 [Dioscorea sansibarensis]